MQQTGRIVAMLGAALLLGGCGTMARDALTQYQCEQEASNRPDAAQRQAECQLQATGRRLPESQSPNA